jgi:hypothetical protein
LAGVSLHVDPGTGISTLTAVGRVTANGVIAALDEFYAGSPTLLALCDLSQADLLSFSTEDVARIVAFTIARAQLGWGEGLLLRRLEISNMGWHECTRFSPTLVSTQ